MSTPTPTSRSNPITTVITIHSSVYTIVTSTPTSRIDPLTNPGTSRIVTVTIACSIIVLIITGLTAGFKMASLIRAHRESSRRKSIQAQISTGGQIPGWMTQDTKKKWGGRKVKNAHRQVEWEGIAA